MKAKTSGELIQIDHMTHTVDVGMTIKEFQAIYLITKLLVTHAYSSASSTNAKDFLERTIKALPFPIRSIQVDGGSEFMKEFEEACKITNIELLVLPPRRPQFNGNVERSNWTTKYEFFYQYTGASKMDALREKLPVFTVQNTYGILEFIGAFFVSYVANQHITF